MEIFNGIVEEKLRKVTRPDRINQKESLRCELSITRRRTGCSLMKEPPKLVVEERKDEGKAEMDVRIISPVKNTSSQKAEEPVEKREVLFHHIIRAPTTSLDCVYHVQVLRTHVVQQYLQVVSGQ